MLCRIHKTLLSDIENGKTVHDRKIWTFHGEQLTADYLMR